jgi:hypothetical protein
MTAEQQVGVLLSPSSELEALLADIDAAARRAAGNEPGDRTDIVAYEGLCAALEARAAQELLTGGPSRSGQPDAELRAGLYTRLPDGVVVYLRLPLEPGPKRRARLAAKAPDPAARVPARDDLQGRRLVEWRFREQLTKALEAPGSDRNAVLAPSGIHNRVLTEVLREFVQRQGGVPVHVPVVYQDGSIAASGFPFRCLDLASRVSTGRCDLELRLALLSMRHTEMDPVVDGTWLRNYEVSRPRPAAQTDDLVTAATRSQLDSLTARGTRRVRLRIFQTGLETAIVGFFRAVTQFLQDHPDSLEVLPMFYAPRSGNLVGNVSDLAGFEAGQVWATRS